MSPKVIFCRRSVILPDLYAAARLCNRPLTVGCDPDGISAQTFRRGYAAGRRIQRSSLALAACASVPPRRARSDILHRSSDTGMLLAWVDHNTRQKPVPRPWRRFGCWAAYTTRLCRRNARSARFTGLEMRLADDRPITTYRDGRHADFTRGGGPDPDHYSAATVSRMAGADGVVARHGARVACEPTRPTARMV